MGVHRQTDSREARLTFGVVPAAESRNDNDHNVRVRILSAMLTKKGKYGLKALVHLAGLLPGQPALVNEIAAANNIPKPFLDAILGELRNAGFVRSRMGKKGGYMLARPAHEIQLGHVVRVLDGPLAPIPCASRTAYRRCDDCTSEEKCSVRLMMLEVRNAIATLLDNRSLADLRAMADNGELARTYDI
jgi:Rrf2 family protein